MCRSPTSSQNNIIKSKSKLESSKIDLNQLSGNNSPTRNNEFPTPIKVSKITPVKELKVIKDNSPQKNDQKIQDLKGSLVKSNKFNEDKTFNDMKLKTFESNCDCEKEATE